MTRQAKRTPNATQNNPPLFRFLLGCLTALTIYAFWGWSMGGWTVALGMVIFFGFAAPLFFFFWSAKLVLGLSKIKKINLRANLELSESILRAFYKKPELFDDIEVMKFESPQSFFYFQESLFSSKVRLYLSSGFLDTKVSDLEGVLLQIFSANRKWRWLWTHAFHFWMSVFILPAIVFLLIRRLIGFFRNKKAHYSSYLIPLSFLYHLRWTWIRQPPGFEFSASKVRGLNNSALSGNHYSSPLDFSGNSDSTTLKQHFEFSFWRDVLAAPWFIWNPQAMGDFEKKLFLDEIPSW